MSFRRRIAARAGKTSAFRAVPADSHDDLASFDAADRAIIERVTPYTMTGPSRLEGLLNATTHLVENGLPGAFVECGVWQGGSMLAVALRLLELGHTDRDLYLFDTFEGMSEPTEEDVSDYSPPALEAWEEAEEENRRVYGGFFDADLFDEASVRARLIDSGYPADRMHFVRGKVEDTIPGVLPSPIALLRLDTDWYESTRHEMEHLYPQLVRGGVLIVDDYGHWKGCRQAVDEYFARPEHPRPLLQRVDYTCRQGVKP